MISWASTLPGVIQPVVSSRIPTIQVARERDIPGEVTVRSDGLRDSAADDFSDTTEILSLGYIFGMNTLVDWTWGRSVRPGWA